MRPEHERRNGDGGGAAQAEDSASASEGEDAAPQDELALVDDAWPARALAALNALRKSRQHYDTLLVAGGAEVPAHRAVLAAASPYLLEALAAPAPAAASPPAYRVDDVDPDALRELVEFAYTGRVAARSAAAARRLYRAAWRLRLEPVRARLAERLLRRAAPADAVQLRALPDLAPHHLRDLDAYIADHFDAVCESGALATLPLIRIEMLRESSAEDGAETPLAVAEAALAWLRDTNAADLDLEELCARTHLLYVDASGALRDCGELPEARGDAPELQEYRRSASPCCTTRSTRWAASTARSSCAASSASTSPTASGPRCARRRRRDRRSRTPTATPTATATTIATIDL